MEITLFSGWHFMYIALILGVSIGLALALRGRSEKTKQIVLSVYAILVTVVYIADFFMMPLMRDDHSIDIDKLPFHFCTVLAIFVLFSQFNKKFSSVKDVIACFAIVSTRFISSLPGCS